MVAIASSSSPFLNDARALLSRFSVSLIDGLTGSGRTLAQNDTDEILSQRLLHTKVKVADRFDFSHSFSKFA
jgi:hypothetical protein